MIINNVRLSENKLSALMNVMPEICLREEYELNGLSDIEISKKYSMSQSWVCKLRKIYSIKTDPRYRFRRNSLRHVPLTEYQRKVLHGSLFGDSCIAIQSSGSGYWKCTHSTKQEIYLLKKAQILNPFTAKVFYGTRPFKKGGKEFPFVCARSFSLPQFTDYRKNFYPDGVKNIDLNLIGGLTPTGIAYWWMDDGLKSEYGFHIVVYDRVYKTHLKEVTEMFQDLFNLSIRISWYGDEGNICVLKQSHNTMWNYVKAEVTNDLIYKLPKKYRDNQQPSLIGNDLEGSTTEESLNSTEHGGNSYLDKVTYLDMPGTCVKQTSGDTV